MTATPVVSADQDRGRVPARVLPVQGGLHEGLRYRRGTFARVTDPVKRGLAETLRAGRERQFAMAADLGVSLPDVREALVTAVQEEYDAAATKGDCMFASVEMPLRGEVYSDAEPARSAAEARGHRTMPTLTLYTGDDFTKKADRDRAFALVDKLPPFCLMIAFPCVPWSSIRNFEVKRGDPALMALRHRHRALAAFAVMLGKCQMPKGRHFIPESPQNSQAWKVANQLAQLRKDARVLQADFHQCMWGARGVKEGKLIRKATRFLTSSGAVAEHFCIRCSLDHDHEKLEGGNTKAAAVYPKQMAKDLVRCVEKQWDLDRQCGYREVFSADGVGEVGSPDDGKALFEESGEDDDDDDYGEEEDDEKGESAFDPTGDKASLLGIVCPVPQSSHCCVCIRTPDIVLPVLLHAHCSSLAHRERSWPRPGLCAVRSAMRLEERSRSVRPTFRVPELLETSCTWTRSTSRRRVVSSVLGASTSWMRLLASKSCAFWRERLRAPSST